MLSNYRNKILIILLSAGQHVNCKFIAQPSDRSVRLTVMSFPFCSTENVSGHVCPPNQFDLSTFSGHRKPFPMVIFLNVTPGPVAPTLATKHSENCRVS